MLGCPGRQVVESAWQNDPETVLRLLREALDGVMGLLMDNHQEITLVTWCKSGRHRSVLMVVLFFHMLMFVRLVTPHAARIIYDFYCK
jgi:hypothetical protein